MTTEERMMIMGMCLQGLLANQGWAKSFATDTRTIPNPNADIIGSAAGEPKTIEETFYRPMTDDELTAQWAKLIREAHRLANALAPLPETTDAERIAAITKIAYEAVRAADTDGSGAWVTLAQTRSSLSERDQDNLDGVFERVSRWFHDPCGFPETTQDRIIAAIVAASRAD